MNPMENQNYRRISLHNHSTTYSDCSGISALDIIRHSARAKLDGVVLTEHDHLWEDEELSELRQKAIREKLCNPDFMIFAGREVTAVANGKTAHALVFGYKGEIPVGMDLTQLCGQVHGQNAAIILAHPGRNSGRRVEDFWRYPADGAEYFSQNQDNQWVREMLKIHNPDFALIGSDDVHNETHIAYFTTLFPYWVRTEADIVKAIKCKYVKPEVID